MTYTSARAPVRYAAFGHGLASELPFPELREANDLPVRWRFSTAAALPPMKGARRLGEDRLYAEVFARLIAHDHGHRIEVDDTGNFEISSDRLHLTWETRASAWPDFVRAHLLGRVLGTALYLDGLLPLHGSAVLARDGVVAFLAPKGVGKSSLAYAATCAGARLATDDTLPVAPGAVVMAWPGVQSMRVREDVFAALGTEAPAGETREGKRLMPALARSQVLEAPAPLAAIYLLDPSGDDADALDRTDLPASLAAMALVSHVKVAGMLGPSAAGPMLERAATISRTVPVRLLHPPRDLARLDEAARTVLAWHGGAP